MTKSISVIVPVYNAAPFIGQCVESLLAVDYPRDCLEILVVDNGSTDPTPAIVSRYPVTSLREERRGAAAARNTGVMSARGDIIAFTDADCLVDEQWVREIDRTFGNPHVDAVMGFTAGINPNFWACLEQENFEAFWFRQEAQGYALKRPGVDTRNCAIRKTVLEACGLLNAELTDCEDLELSRCLRARQYHLVLNTEMRAWHHNRTELDHILRLKADHARAFMQIVAQQPEGFDCAALPCDFRTFFGIDNRTIRGFQLHSALLGLRLLRLVMSLGLRGFCAVKARPRGLAVRLFKTVCGVVWEITILTIKRQQEK